MANVFTFRYGNPPNEVWEDFYPTAGFGRIALIRSGHLISRLIQWFERHLLRTQGFWNHAGVIGHDGYFYEMVASGLKVQWLGNYLFAGATVAILDLKKIWLDRTTMQDKIWSIGRVKRLYKDKTRYDLWGLLTAGWMRSKRRLVCSQLVRIYLMTLTQNLHGFCIADPFITPDEVVKYCDILSIYGPEAEKMADNG